MRRLICLMAAAAIAAGPLAVAGGAMANDHREQRREQQQPARGGGGARQQQQGPFRGGEREYRGGEREYRGGGERADPRFESRGDPRSESRGDPRYGEYRGERADPRYESRGYGAPNGYAAPPRRGGYLSQGGPVIEDPGRLHLRPPPRGYDWVRTPGGMALVQQGTGRVYDVVPNY